jgi:chorismate lyase
MMPPDFFAAEAEFVSIPLISLDTYWQDASKMALPQALSPWILEAASLTARLKRHCQQFRVQVLQQQRITLPRFLQPLLPDTRQAQVREVILWCNETPCVYAQSWLPEQTLAALRPLADLGERPLGDYIFQHQDLHRGTIEAAQLQLLLPQLQLNTPCLARRSVFQLQQQPLLVAEVFLPAMANLSELRL